MWKSVLAFLRFAVSPATKGWNLIGPGIASAGTIIAWANHHGLLAAFLFLVGLCLLFLAAGVRLQRRLDKDVRYLFFVDALSAEVALDFSGQEPGSIRFNLTMRNTTDTVVEYGMEFFRAAIDGVKIRGSYEGKAWRVAPGSTDLFRSELADGFVMSSPLDGTAEYAYSYGAMNSDKRFRAYREEQVHLAFTAQQGVIACAHHLLSDQEDKPLKDERKTKK